jgi:hypothetical protein
MQLVLAEMTRFVGQWVIAPETVPANARKMQSPKFNGLIFKTLISTQIIIISTP